VEFVCERDDVGNLVWEKDRACEDGVLLRVGLEGEGCRDAEVLASAADGPEEVCVGCCRGVELLARCEYHVNGEVVFFISVNG